MGNKINRAKYMIESSELCPEYRKALRDYAVSDNIFVMMLYYIIFALLALTACIVMPVISYFAIRSRDILYGITVPVFNILLFITVYRLYKYKVRLQYRMCLAGYKVYIGRITSVREYTESITLKQSNKVRVQLDNRFWITVEDTPDITLKEVMLLLYSSDKSLFPFMTMTETELNRLTNYKMLDKITPSIDLGDNSPENIYKRQRMNITVYSSRSLNTQARNISRK